MTVTQYVSNTAFVMLQGQGDLYFGSLNTTDASKNVWRRVYSDVNKPTAADVGAVSTSGGTINADYVPLTLKNVTDKQALVLRGEKKDGTLRWYVGSGSGSNDNVQLNNYVTGTSFDLGDTAKINAPLAITGTVTPSNYTNFDERYSLKNTASKAATGWFKDATTGMIFQWGGGAIAASGTKLTFPIAFPTACVRVIATDIGTDHRSFGAAPSSTTQAVFYPETNGTSCSYFAIGY
ncbi:gp53-like domain-containing protein [Rahnella victoriana]|nr:hypothetical protein [Rahnella victoriana]UHM90790.1 hypothetical protein J9880_21390 [Rahnella victoriana]